jgi:hypothetical protein
MSDYTNQAHTIITLELSKQTRAKNPSQERLERSRRVKAVLEDFARYESRHQSLLGKLPLVRDEATSSLADYLDAATIFVRAVHRLVEDELHWQDRLRPVGQGRARELAPVIFRAAADGESPKGISRLLWRASQTRLFDRLPFYLGNKIPRLLLGLEQLDPITEWQEAHRPTGGGDVDGLTPTGEVRFKGEQTKKPLGASQRRLFVVLWDKDNCKPRGSASVNDLIRKVYPKERMMSGTDKARVVNKLTTLARRVNALFTDSNVPLQITPAGIDGRQITAYRLSEV